MITIGGKPIIWHIMKQYSHYGVNEFIICLGYKGYVVKEYFANYFLHMSDVTFDMANNEMQVHEKHVEPWKITLIETGEDTQTGGRLKKVRDYIGNETFCFTYGDGVSDINIQKLIEFHQSHGKLATVTAIQPPGRYGALNLNSERVEQFQEKPAGDGSWINGGFFVLEPEVMDFIDGPTTAWEESPLKKLADQQALMAYRHTGFWKAMDTLRDKVSLENLWQTTAPWKVWE
jgi:glucose-1-phosphate cytidylyltransferase